MFKRSVLGLTMVLLGVLAVSAPAAVISVNIDTCPQNQLDPLLTGGINYTAGVVPVAYWNDLMVGSGAWQNVREDSGEWTGAQFAAYYEEPGSSYVPVPPFQGYSAAMPTEPDNKLLSGHIYHAAGLPTIAQFQNIPFAAYDLYVYFNSGAVTGNVQTFSIDGTSFSALGSELTTTRDSAFVLSNGTNDANYVKFSSVNLPSFTLRATSAGNSYNYFNGFQIVEVPEPMTLGFLAMGGLLLRRRS